MFGLNVKAAAYLVVFLAAGGLLAGAYFAVQEYNKTQQEAAVAKEQLRILIDRYEKYKVAVHNRIDQLQNARKIANQELAKSEERANELGNLLSKHDFGYLAFKKPGLIERRVNSATKRVFMDIQGASSDFFTRQSVNNTGTNQ